MMRSVVVGLDDSPAAEAALRWAAGYARALDRQLVAVHVRCFPADASLAWAPEYVDASTLYDLGTEDLSARLAALFTAVDPRPSWALREEAGPVGAVLVGAACNAELLVVGTQAHTGLERFLSGSVSHYCLSHSPVPVLAVPAPQPASAGRRSRLVVGL